MSAKHALPLNLPDRASADHDRLQPLPGPWMESRWVVIPGVGSPRRCKADPCAAADCGRDHDVTVDGVSLCYPHGYQWRRAGRPEVHSWLPTAKPPQQRRRANGVSSRVIDFAAMPPLVATEVRYVVSRKVEAGDWTPNRLLLGFLEAMTAAVAQEGASSLLDRRPQDWALLIQQLVRPSARRDYTSYARTFFATLHRALLVDPWAEDTWLWRSGFERLVHADAYSHNGCNILWGKITQDWLRQPVKTWARECLSTGKRAWGTVITWSQCMAQLSAYLEHEGIDHPDLLDRSVFLDYLVYLGDMGASKHTLSGVNIAASLLATLQVEVPGTAFGSDVFLRYGENVVPKVREPRPYPADVVELIDSRVLTDPNVHESARLMLQLTRWGGLRISELIALPIDCLRHNGRGGYWIEYYMTKTRSIRAFPIPEDLAQRLLAWQAAVRATYGDAAAYMFPSPARSNVSRQRVQPWSASGFRLHVRTAFGRNDIKKSSITGEIVTGGEIHRYRHTIGTALLNNGWSQREVQDFLGHESPTMTSTYAAILDETLAAKVRDFRERQQALPRTAAVADPGVERLRARFAYELPDGGCLLPANQRCDIRDNPCADCAFFDGTGRDVRPVHEERRRRLKLIIERSEDPQQRDLNQRALNDVERILAEGNEESTDVSAQ